MDEGALRVEGAVCYRLVALFGWDDLRREGVVCGLVLGGGF